MMSYWEYQIVCDNCPCMYCPYDIWNKKTQRWELYTPCTYSSLIVGDTDTEENDRKAWEIMESFFIYAEGEI